MSLSIEAGVANDLAVNRRKHLARWNPGIEKPPHDQTVIVTELLNTLSLTGQEDLVYIRTPDGLLRPLQEVRMHKKGGETPVRVEMEIILGDVVQE
jgi:hypothetical protein